MIAAAACAAAASPASALEAVTPQASDANAAFLAYAPPPATPMKVCVVDTGVDLTTDAAPAVIERWNVYGGDVGDGGGSGIAKHGTFVAGVIASQADGRDSVGIWPQAKIVSVRVFAGSGGGTTVAAYVTALNKCRDRGTEVVNLSLSGLDGATGEQLAELEDKVGALRSLRDINVVAAVGNNGGAVGYPARFAEVLGVGASANTGGLCGFSARGAGLDISTLGCSSELSWPGGGIGAGDGTSFSAPVATGVLAALRAYRPDLSAPAAERLLLATAASGATPRVDAGAAFVAAGLTTLTRIPSTSRDAQQPLATSPVAHSPDLIAHRLHELGVKVPRLSYINYRRGILTVRVTGIPDYARAIFTLDGRRYFRASGVLRLHLRRPPRRVHVLTDVPGVGRTQSLGVSVQNLASSTAKKLKQRR